MLDNANISDVPVAVLQQNGVIGEGMEVHGRYRVVCTDADGNEKWVEEFDNLVFNAGKADMLDKYFAGSAYTAAWFMGLIGSSPTFNAADTSASHAGWTEDTNYSSGTRVAPSWAAATGTGGGSGSAGTGSKATTATAFSMNATTTIYGVFLTTLNTKSGTTGITLSGGAFGASRSVASGDTLSVTYTFTN